MDSKVISSFIPRHALLFEGIGGEYNIPMVANARSVRDFDEGLTRGTFLLVYFMYLHASNYLS